MMMILSGAIALARRCSATTDGCRRFFATTPYDFYQDEKECAAILAQRRRKAEEEEKRRDVKRREVLSRLDPRYINPYKRFKVSCHDYPSAKTVVWWDMDGAVIPDSCTDFYQLLDNMRRSVNHLGYLGPFCFRGYGDFSKLSPAVREQIKVKELNVSEIQEEDTFTHIPAKQGDEDTSLKIVVSDMLASTTQYRDSINYFVISSAGRLYFFALNSIGLWCHHNILLARPSVGCPDFDQIATSVWHWEDLVEGKPALPLAETFVKSDDDDDVQPFRTAVRSMIIKMMTPFPSAFRLKLMRMLGGRFTV